MIYRFDTFVLNTESLELRRGDDPVVIEPQVFSVLVYLVENRDRVVTRDELIKAVWGGRAISDGTLNSRINSVRRALGDSGQRQSIIKTFARRGFRFVASISEDGSTDDGSGGVASRPDKPSIAVLPFRNLSNDPEQEYFSDGISEDIITALSRAHWFGVVSRNSSFAYKGAPPDVRRVAEELAVRYVLEGSVRRTGNRVRVTAQLIDGPSGNHLWAQRYDRELDDIFALQDEITEAVAGQIEPELRKAEIDRTKVIRPESLDAWDIYQRGMWHIHRADRPDFHQALDHFRRATEIDPDFGPAHARTAQMCFYLVYFGQIDDRASFLEEGMAAGRHAVELDGDDSVARMALGGIHFLRGEYEESVAEHETAIQLNPLNGEAHFTYGTALLYMGRLSEALEKLETAVRVSPNDPLIGPTLAKIAEAHLYLHEHGEAVEWGRKAMRKSITPRLWGRAVLAAALAHAGDFVGAKHAVAEILSRRPEFSLGFARENYPMQVPKHMSYFIEGLRKTGLPE